MALQVVFHRLAVQEARSASDWYARHSPEVAERFRYAVLDTVDRIANDIGTHPVSNSRFRYARVVRFPYRLIYCLESETTARIIAVSHFRRRPGYWRTRQ